MCIVQPLIVFHVITAFHVIRVFQVNNVRYSHVILIVNMSIVVLY